MEKSVKEMRKRFRGWLALVLCFMMVFGNSLVVFAQSTTYSVGQLYGSSKVDLLEKGDVIEANIDSGYHITLIYQDSTGTEQLGKNEGGLSQSVTVGDYSQELTLNADKITSVEQWKVVGDPKVDYDEGDPIYQITLKAISEDPAPTTSTTPTTGGQSSSSSATPQAVPHTHSFEWTVTKDPTKYEDGLEEYRCKACGAVEASQPISMYMFRIKELYGLIKEAPQGGTVTYDFGDLSVISDYVLAKLAQRSDVTVTITFTYGGEAHSITFPAGTDYTAVLNDADTMYGFYGVAARLGLAVE